MKAWILHTPGTLRPDAPLVLEEVPDPEPEKGEILIRVAACGLSSADLGFLQGTVDAPRLPVIPGHQVVGTVVRGTRRFDEGERVGVTWLHDTCGACAACFRGDENLCANARLTGIHADGGYAELIKVPDAYAHRLPEGVGDEALAAVLGEGVTALRALRQADLEEGESVGLFGFGTPAEFALQVARDMGCHVYVWTRSEERRGHARSLGAEWVGNPASRKAPQEPLDRAIVFGAGGELIPLALDAIRPGGSVSVASSPTTPIPSLDFDRHLAGEKTLRSSSLPTRQDAEDLLEMAEDQAVHMEARVFPFERIHEAFAALADVQLGRTTVLRVS